MWYYLSMKNINVLSLFDGMSCGQIALERADISVKNYYASEIDKFAISHTQYRHPNTAQLGNVKNWDKWNLPKIDLLLGGSPCQGFSIAGKRLNWEDPRSKLFFEYVSCLHHYKPKYFLYENVASMKKEIKDAISLELGVEPVMINAALVSAQSRKRLYWTNIPDITQPEDRDILLKDILEEVDAIEEKYYVRTGHAGIKKSSEQKAGCLTGGGNSGGNHSDMTLVYGGAMRGRYNKDRTTTQKFESNKIQKSNSLTTVGKDSLVHLKTIPHGYIKESKKDIEKYPSLCAQSPASKHLIRLGSAVNIKGHDYNKRVYSPEGISPTLPTFSGGNQHIKIAVTEDRWRRLTVTECERLQTVEDNWTLTPYKNRMMSNSQRYKMLGNGWNIEPIVHILSHIPTSM